MQYDDYQLPDMQSIEAMAREYNKALLKQGFMFVRLNEESDEKQILIQSIKTLLKNTYNLLLKLYEFSPTTSRQNVKEAITYYKNVSNFLKEYFGDITSAKMQTFALGNYLKTKNKIICNISKIAINLHDYIQKYEKNLDLAFFYDNLFKIIELLSQE